jgi:hypothetical protein
MKLILEIEMDNDAFQGDRGEAGDEVARILTRYAVRITGGGEFTQAKLLDRNGAAVGSARIVRDKSEQSTRYLDR